MPEPIWSPADTNKNTLSMPKPPSEPFVFAGLTKDAKGKGVDRPPVSSPPATTENVLPAQPLPEAHKARTEGEDDQGFTIVRAKKRPRYDPSIDATAAPNQTLPSRTALATEGSDPGRIISSGAPSSVAARAISKTLTIRAQRAYPPLPANLAAPGSSTTHNRTPRPINGYPHVQGDCPHHYYKNVAQDVFAAWMASKEPKCLAQVFGTSTNGDPGQISDISAYLRLGLEAVSGKTGFRVSPPIPENPAGENDPPFYYLVTNPDPKTILALIKERIHSLENPPITFECAAVDDSAPSLICALRGFSSTITEEAAKEIIDGHLRFGAIKRLVENQELTSYGFVDPARVFNTVNSVMETLRVEVLPYKKAGGALSPLVIVHLYTTAESAEEWFEWRDAIASTSFTSLRDGTGTGTTPPLCTFCHGMGHPAGMCPFEELPNWNGTAGRQNIARIRAKNGAPRSRGGKGPLRSKNGSTRAQ